uniref:Flap endonuclease 1 n=1 Tax=Panagrolaimus davidi TaxID=227884 RepID=A0A914PSQ2_9BILA
MFLIYRHLNGFFYKTIKIMEAGMKPVYIFNGVPPTLKAEESERRGGESRDKDNKQLKGAVQKGDHEAIDKYKRRLVKPSEEQIEESKRLLKLMGVPIIEAPAEAIAQCAELVKAGKVFATASENMGALAFGSSILLRHLSFSTDQKKPVKEYNLDRILKEMDFTQEQLIDMCILLGCNYCPSITGIGPKRAFELIKTYKTIERSLKKLDADKYPPPKDWQFAAARELFLHPEVIKADEIDLKWTKPDEKGIVEFLCHKKGFNEARIKTALERLHKGRKTATQSRVDSFFQSDGHKVSTPTATKRKAENAKNVCAKKAKTVASGKATMNRTKRK